LAAPDAEQRGVNLQTDFPEESLPVTADSDFMKQAILNVVLNGVQAMTNGGKLWLTARREEGNVVTEIRDEGIGIPRDLQEKVFELYFTTKPGGSGIGLAQTYQIMQWHYGSVEFESQDGKGTTFRLRLPLTEVRVNGVKEDRVEPGLAPAGGTSPVSTR
jgi:signal transduction histidine kinase